MKRAKGCLNPECTEYKKTYYKDTDEYCVKCGNKLNFVCKHPKCFKQLPNDVNEKYCITHLEEQKDKRDKRADAGKKVLSVLGGAVATVGGIIGAAGGIAAKIAKK